MEGSYLLPDKYSGFSYLEAVREVMSDKRTTLDVMSFNIRNGKAKDGDSSRETATVSDRSKSFNAWGGDTKASVIDYIYYRGFDGCEFFRTMKDGHNGRKYLSDHYPIRAKLKF